MKGVARQKELDETERGMYIFTDTPGIKLFGKLES